MNLNDRFMISDGVVLAGCGTCGAKVECMEAAEMHNEWHNELERFIELIKTGSVEWKEV
jgi:hypothetical protein